MSFGARLEYEYRLSVFVEMLFLMVSSYSYIYLDDLVVSRNGEVRFTCICVCVCVIIGNVNGR